MKRILILIIILLFGVSAVSAAANFDLQAPNEFEHSIYWDRNDDMDIYSMKGDNNTMLYVDKYDADNDAILFESDPEFDYYVTPMGNNTYLCLDKSVHEGSINEVVEHGGEKYLVYVSVMGNPDNAKVTDSAKYLVEFNQLNNVEPVAV